MRIPPKAVAGVAGAIALALPVIASWEGLRTDPYRDIVGVWTVCYGATRAPMRRYTAAECEAMLRAEAERYADDVLQCVPALADRPYQLAASVSLAYNIGSGAFCRSKAARLFNAGDWRGGCDQFRRWIYAGGKPARGLVNRRDAERELCMTEM